MYISDKNQKRSWMFLKTLFIYLAASLISFTFDKVYSLFGHGVDSASIQFAFLYPLIGGVVVFFLLWLFKSEAELVSHFRAWYNLYNSGIAALTLGSLLRGVFEIAGTSSAYTIIYYIAGSLMMLAGTLGYFLNFMQYKKYRGQEQ